MKSILAAVALVVLLSASEASAHREDYTGSTLVFLTLERGEFEPEYILDVVRPDDEGSFLRHTLALEFGITDRWMIDGRLATLDGADASTNLGSAHLETRYRFGEEGAFPVDVAFSAETGWERANEGSDDFEFEPRLILSKDFGRVNTTANFVAIVSSGEKTSLIVNGGVRYDASRTIRIGSEFAFDERTRTGSVMPQIWFALPSELTLKLGASERVHGGDRFFRFVIEKEF